MQCVDLGGRRIIKKNFFKQKTAYEISECLVGSEMCIRDRVDAAKAALTNATSQAEIDEATKTLREARPVSYTHLTLPTICSV